MTLANVPIMFHFVLTSSSESRPSPTSPKKPPLLPPQQTGTRTL